MKNMIFKLALAVLAGSLFTGCMYKAPSQEYMVAQQLDMWCLYVAKNDKEKYDDAMKAVEKYSKPEYGDRIQRTSFGDPSASVTDRSLLKYRVGLFWREIGTLYRPTTCDAENKAINMVIEVVPEKLDEAYANKQAAWDTQGFIKYMETNLAKRIYDDYQLIQLLKLGTTYNLIFLNYETKKEIARRVFDYKDYEKYTKKN